MGDIVGSRGTRNTDSDSARDHIYLKMIYDKANKASIPSSPSYTVCLLSGAAAGTAVDVSLFPLDTLKTRLQSDHGFWKAGGFRRIYSGIGPAAVGSAPNAALFFVTYEWMKATLPKQLGKANHSLDLSNDPRIHMAAASMGEVAACLIRVPVEIVKQRRQADHTKTAVSIVLREIPFSLIQFPLWEALKRSWSRKQNKSVDPIQSAACGALAGGVSAGLTCPLDVAKTRIMLAEPGS